MIGEKTSRIKLPLKEYKKLCLLVLERDGDKCRCCGMRQTLHVHHVVFRSAQGDDVESNLVTLCELCHSAAHFTLDAKGMGMVIVSKKRGNLPLQKMEDVPNAGDFKDLGFIFVGNFNPAKVRLKRGR